MYVVTSGIHGLSIGIVGFAAQNALGDIHLSRSGASTPLSQCEMSAPTGPWYRDITPAQWRVLAAAKAGWMLDAMDFMLYVMAIGQLRAYFGFDDATAGMIG